MKGTRRDRATIIYLILSVCGNGGANKTKIVYDCNLNFKTASVYLDDLIKKDYIVYEGSKFMRTSKAEDLVSQMRILEDILFIKEE